MLLHAIRFFCPLDFDSGRSSDFDFAKKGERKEKRMGNPIRKPQFVRGDRDSPPSLTPSFRSTSKTGSGRGGKRGGHIGTVCM